MGEGGIFIKCTPPTTLPKPHPKIVYGTSRKVEEIIVAL